MILLACKSSEQFKEQTKWQKACGLYPSCWHLEQYFSNFVTEIFNDSKDLEQFIIKNSPEKVIIQAIWMEPNVLRYFANTYKSIKFYLHIRSEIPFLQNDGMAFEAFNSLASSKIGLITNSENVYNSLKLIYSGNVEYLPNLYYHLKVDPIKKADASELNVGCFGAIRPMKNILTQAIASIILADRMNTKLRFHINATRVEGGNEVLRNLRALFVGRKHELIEVPWLERIEMLKYISQLDIGLQVSLTESFNMVIADYVSMKIPVVVSNSIAWIRGKKPHVENPVEIADCMKFALSFPGECLANYQDLQDHNFFAQRKWNKWIQS